MIDPNSIMIQKNDLRNVIDINHIPEFDLESYDLLDEKDFNKYLKDIEKIVRKSFEYREFIKYLKDNFGMNKCAFLQNVSNAETHDIKIELHHYPFSLYDIVVIVFRKRQINHESLSVFMVAKEVMELHYKLMIGLIPLSETAHQLVHAGRLFIPIDKVLGRYKLFVEYYYPYIDPELLDTLRMIEKATEEHSEVNDTSILNQNIVTYNITDQHMKLPEIKKITDNMYNQIEMIKNNNYMIPNINEVKLLNGVNPEKEKKRICPIRFIK